MRRAAAHHDHRRRLRGFGYLRRLGPGIVTGAADDDPSGIGTYSQVGAAFRFNLIWTTLVVFPLAAAVQETAARLGLVSGKGLAALIRERFPRWVLLLSVALVSVANVFNIGADLGSMAAATRLLIPVPHLVLVLAITILTVGLEVFVSYHRYSRFLKWLTLSLVAYVAVLFVVHVDWGALASHLIPSLGWDRAEIAALIAILGTTISPYLFFWQSSEEVEEAREHHTGRVDESNLRAMRVDVIAGMGSAVAVMFAIMVSAAVTLGAHGVTTIGTADQAAEALRPIAGSLASLLFTAGIVGTGLLAIPVLAGSTAYAIAEGFGWQEGLDRPPREARAFYTVIAVATGIGVVLNVVGINPIRALYLAAILNGLAAPPLILLMLILSNSHGAVGSHTGRRVSDVLVSLALLAMTALPVLYLLR